MEPTGNNGQPLPLSPGVSNGNAGGANGPVHLSEAQFATLQLLRYFGLLRARWMLIVVATIGIGLGFGLYTKFLAVKWYRAQAVVTPVPPASGMSLAGSAGEMLDGMGGGIASLLSFGGGSDTVTMAERYVAIMNSYAFTTDLIKKYHLERNIIGVRSKNAPTVTKWLMHTAMTDRFTTDYDYKSGNLTLYFMDPSPDDAKRILGYYLDSLQDKLRNEEVQSATSAAASLQEEVRKTSDALLQSQLYELMARQIQREKVAQVQADFAFKVVEPPVVPDNYYAPKARHNAEIAAVITFTLICFWILAADFICRAKSQLEILNRAPDQPAPAPGPAPAWTAGEAPPRLEDPAGPHPRFLRNLRPKP